MLFVLKTLHSRASKSHCPFSLAILSWSECQGKSKGSNRFQFKLSKSRVDLVP